MQKGATHYIVKPIDSDNLLKIISFYLDKQKLSQSEDLPEFCGIIGRSKRMKDLFKEISIVSKSEATVLIEGESGTGKELIARAIHKLSKRSDSPLLRSTALPFLQNF